MNLSFFSKEAMNMLDCIKGAWECVPFKCYDAFMWGLKAKKGVIIMRDIYIKIENIHHVV